MWCSDASCHNPPSSPNTARLSYTPQQIRDQYDHLAADDIQACLAYAKEVIQSERVHAAKR